MHCKSSFSKCPCPGNHDHVSFCWIPVVVPLRWLIAWQIVDLWNPPLCFWLLVYYFLFKAHRHALQHLLFKIPVSWESWSCPFLLFLNSSNSAFTLANSSTNCWSMKSSSMILTSCLLFCLRHIDTHYKSSFSKFPCPGNHDHVSFCLIPVVVPLRWLKA